MEDPKTKQRAEISRRLKAARWLRGGLDEKGRPAPLSPEALAQTPQLVRNGISANAIAEIERMVKDARPMELREIIDALELPAGWFDVAGSDAAATTAPDERLDYLVERVDDLGEVAHVVVRLLTNAGSDEMEGRGAGIPELSDLAEWLRRRVQPDEPQHHEEDARTERAARNRRGAG